MALSQALSVVAPAALLLRPFSIVSRHTHLPFPSRGGRSCLNLVPRHELWWRDRAWCQSLELGGYHVHGDGLTGEVTPGLDATTTAAIAANRNQSRARRTDCG